MPLIVSFTLCVSTSSLSEIIRVVGREFLQNKTAEVVLTNRVYNRAAVCPSVGSMSLGLLGPSVGAVSSGLLGPSVGSVSLGLFRCPWVSH